ncbi:MAG: transcriptional regulator [Desulfovibrio desulfuricans]|nr:transcriptional regulator [Desulfovibrio desulfuricans]
MAEHPRLTPILRQLVLHAPNGLPAKAVAGLLGRDYTTLLAEVGERSGHKAGVELLLPLMDVTESTLPMDVMAEALDGFFVRVPALAAQDPCGQVARQCMRTVKDFGRMMAGVADALEDGRITEEERRQVAEQGYQAQTAILTLLRLVDLASRPGG